MRGPELTGRLIGGRYEILSFIGEGGYASVWKARQLQPEGVVAMKVLHPDHASDPRVIESFLREAQLYVPFRGDPHIVTILESGHDHENGVYFLVMTLLDQTIGEIVEKQGPFPLDRVIRLADDIGQALETVHAAGLVHRDVKGSNIMTVPGKDRFVLTDFGIGFVQGAAEKTVTPTELAKVGAWAYASPERIRARSKDDIQPEADYYSLGVVLFRAATGRYPYPPQFPAVIQHHLETPVPDPRAVRPELPASLAELIARCLGKDPAYRLSGAEYRKALDRARQDVLRTMAQVKASPEDPRKAASLERLRKSATEADGPRQPFRFPSIPRKLAWIAGGVALLGVVITLVAVMFLRGVDVRVHSDPSGARFRVWEGEVARGQIVAEGTTPQTVKRLGPKTYTVEFDKSGFFPSQVRWNLESRPESVPLVALEPRLSVRVSTVPEGATARLSLAGQEALGEQETPAEFGDLRAGEYELVVERPGHQRMIERLTLTTESRDISLVLPVQTVASIELFTTPVGARVRIDGGVVDQSTPCLVSDLQPGRRRIRFELEGYQPVEHSVELTAGENRALHVDLRPKGPENGAVDPPSPAPIDQPIPFTMATSPGFAYVYVDGSSKAINASGSVGPWSTSLTQGAHTFRLVNDKSNPKVNVTLHHTVRPRLRGRTLVLNWKDETVTER